MAKGAYAKAGVDYTVIEPFKQAMIAAGKRTVTFPNKRDVHINGDVLHAHGAVFEYRGSKPHLWCNTQEGLGNKNWIAEWMYQNAGTGRTYYEGIGIDTALMAINDVIAQGAMPVVFTDEVAVGIRRGLAMKSAQLRLQRASTKPVRRPASRCPLGNRPP